MNGFIMTLVFRRLNKILNKKLIDWFRIGLEMLRTSLSIVIELGIAAVPFF